MTRISPFLGLSLQISAEKRETQRQRLAEVAAATADPAASRVKLTAGEAQGQTGVLRSWAAADGRVSVLLADGRTILADPTAVERVDAAQAGFAELNAEQKAVAVENGFQASVFAPRNPEELQAVVAYLRSADAGLQALGRQMVTNHEALKAAAVTGPDFSHLAVFAAVKLRTLGPNQTEVTVGDKTIFFSYETPVAAEVGGRVIKTNKKWSVTTSRHIKNWLAGRQAEDVPQEELDSLGAGIEAAAKTAPAVKAVKAGASEKAEAAAAMKKAYDEQGPSAVFDLFKKHYSHLGSWEHCEPCEEETPHIDGTCQVCWTAKDGIKAVIRTRTGAQRHNDRQARIWEKARALEKERLARGEKPNPNLTETCPACKGAVIDGICKDCGQDVGLGKSLHKTLKDFGAFGSQKLKADEQLAGTEGVTAFEVEDIGVENSQYFRGRGVAAGGQWDAVFVGIGSTYNEAVEDALELAAMSGYALTPEQEKVAKWDDPKGDVDMVRQVFEKNVDQDELNTRMDEIASGADVTEDEARVQALDELFSESPSESFYHVALFVKGGSDLEAGLKLRLDAAPPKPLSPKTQEILKRIAEQRKREAEAAKPAAPVATAEAPAAKPGLAPPTELARKAEEARQAAKPAAPPKPPVPPYKGIQKPEFLKKKTGEEAHRLKHEEPGSVKEAERAGKMLVTEDRPGEIDENALERLKEVPEELKALVRSTLKRREFFAAVDAQLKSAAADIKEKTGYEEQVAQESEELEAIDEMLRNIDEEAGTMDNAILALVRNGLKPNYKFTDADKKKMDEMAKDQDDFLKEAQSRAKVTYTEERQPKLFSDPRKRKGEGATGKPGADTKSKAQVRSALEAGISDAVKKALSKLKDLAKALTSKFKGVTSVLEKATADAPKAEAKASLSPAQQALRARAAERKAGRVRA